MRSQSFLLALAILASAVVAQDTATATTDATTTADTDTATTAAADATTTDDAATTDDSTTSTETTDTDTALPGLTTTSSSTTSTTTDDASSTDTDNPPGLTTTSALPTLPGQYSYPAPTVPPMTNAPYMQAANLPEGTVFIAVGAILGAFGAAVLIWRAVIACLLHRSVKKAALAQHIANDKASYPAPSAPFYKYSDHASSASLGTMMNGRGVRRTQRGPIPSATPSQSNLFFSPTAPGGGGSAGNRESRFLPSGFYAAGAGAPPQGHEHSISLTNLRPDSRGYPRAIADSSPPESPALTPRRDYSRRDLSSSTLNLNRPTSRAPSAYLEDLLADQPEQFPPPADRSAWH
ncbi:hypothetical protein GGR56DRAFT_656530 [Xylariaceae sp. FL0804]|nr:hypothetical protein GGR56DRAFT_656530 [Xylariaceae sp. FL0804]